MSSQDSAQPLPDFTPAAQHPPGLLRRLLSCHNPCYAISAVLVFWGLHRSFDMQQELDLGLLFGGLVGYTLLLAVTAWGLLRLGCSIWEDIRTIVLVVLLLLVAMSVMLDRAYFDAPRLAVWLDLAGAAFAVLMGEGLLRGLRIKLGAWWRLPFHAIVTLFFLYPLLLTGVMHRPGSAAMQWGLFLFAPSLAVLVATLIPAVRRGAEYVRENGTPWNWPLFPWAIFVVLIACGGLRAYYLCLTLHAGRGPGSIFDLYFLAPLALALGVLALERGLVRNSPAVQRSAFAFAALAVALSGTQLSDGPVHGQFLGLFRETVGASPLFASLCAAILFALWGVVRHARGSLPALALALVGLAFVHRHAGTFDQLSGLQQIAPLACAAAVSVVWAHLRKHSFGWVVTSCLVVATASVAGRYTWLPATGIVLPIHALLACGLVIAARFDDWFAGLVRTVCGFFLLVAAFVALQGDAVRLFHVSPAALSGYVLATVVVAWLYGRRTRAPLFAFVVVFNLLAWSLSSLYDGYHWLRPQMAGLDAVALGLAFFLAATILSVAKAGRLREFATHALRWTAARLDFSRSAPAP